jgi:hypothetical protein
MSQRPTSKHKGSRRLQSIVEVQVHRQPQAAGGNVQVCTRVTKRHSMKPTSQHMKRAERASVRDPTRTWLCGRGVSVLLDHGVEQRRHLLTKLAKQRVDLGATMAHGEDTHGSASERDNGADRRKRCVCVCERERAGL